MGELLLSSMKQLVSAGTTASVELGKQTWEVEENLQDLKQFLKLIKAFLRDVETTTSHSEAVRVWLDWLGDFLAKAQQDVENQLATNSGESSGGVLDVTKRTIHAAVDCVSLAYKVDHINRGLVNILDKPRVLGFQDLLTDLLPTSSSSVKPTTVPFLQDPALIVSREADVSNVVDMLISSSSSSSSSSTNTTSPLSLLPVVSIVGTAGFGKTTLAKMVLKDDRLKTLLEIRRQIWVCISATFDVRKILCEILEDLTSKPAASFEALKKSTIVANIKRELNGKLFLLVLDDVWNKDTSKWDELMACLLATGCHTGKSIILATSRSQDVVSVMRSSQEFTHRISKLHDDQCWSIIKAKSFGKSPMPHNLEVIGRDIAKKCKGVALVASVIGGTMQIERTEHVWSSIWNSKLWNSLENEEDIISVLKLSYDRLDSKSLKLCFEFCSIFPEDSYLDREKLIKLWMAAGFLDSSLANDQHSQTPWEIGSKNFNTLVSNSLFVDVERDEYGIIKTCKMHDLIRSLARSLSKAMALTSDENSLIDFSSIRHLNLIGAEIEQVKRLIQSRPPKLLQSLFCGIDTFSHMSRICKGLKILKLVGPGNELPSSVGDLEDLRYLDVSGTDIVELPSSMTQYLKKLHTLNVRWCRHLRNKLPTEQLVELWHLDYSHEWVMFANIGSLTKLRALQFFPVGVNEGCEIKELGGLSHLQGVLEILNLEHVRSEEKAREAKLDEKKGIDGLRLEWNGSTEGEDCEGVLEGLQPHLNLKHLKIIRYKGKDFPTWLPSTTVMMNSQVTLQNLVRLELDSCSNSEKLPSLGHLPSLTYLYIRELGSLKSIGTDFYGGGNFQALKEFELMFMESLGEWVVETTENMFPSLERLHLAVCHKLGNIPLTNGFRSLEQLSIYRCSSIASISLSKGHSCLKEVSISRCHKLQNISLDGGLPRLQRMIIESCEELRDMGDGLSSCECVREIAFVDCNSLEFLPSFQNCTSLQTVKLVGCPNMDLRLDFLERLKSLVYLMIVGCGSISWGDDNSEPGLITHLEQVVLHAGQLAGFLTYRHASLQSLTLLSGSTIECLPDRMQHLTALQTLKLYRFRALRGFPNWFCHLSSLEELHISCCSNLRSLSPLDAMPKLKCLSLSVCQSGFEGLFDSIPSSLQRLTLEGHFDETITTLPSQIHYMTTLKELELWNFNGIEALPEWLKELSSLQQLGINEFSSLTYIPDLSNLNLLLQINECPKLPSGSFFEGSYAEWSSTHQGIIQ